MSTVIRGVKIKLSPTADQAKTMDAWRREARGAAFIPQNAKNAATQRARRFV